MFPSDAGRQEGVLKHKEKDHFLVFQALRSFWQFFEHIRLYKLILKLTDILKLFLLVAYPINFFSLLVNSKLVVLQFTENGAFLTIYAIFDLFSFLRRLERHPYQILLQTKIFFIMFVLVLLRFYLSQKYFRYGNNVNDEDLKQILNPKSPTNNWIE